MQVLLMNQLWTYIAIAETGHFKSAYNLHTITYKPNIIYYRQSADPHLSEQLTRRSRLTRKQRVTPVVKINVLDAVSQIRLSEILPLQSGFSNL